MMRGCFKLLIGLCICLCSPSLLAAEKRIAFTFDDAPRSDISYFFQPEERTVKLVAALRDADIDQAGFFIRASFLKDESDFHRVDLYADAGHAIANHSFRHNRLRNMTAEDYLADIDRAEEELRPFINRRPWFRFPYLDEGDEAAKHDAVHAGLRDRGLSNGYVTVDNFDWYIDRLAGDAKAAGQCMDQQALQQIYVDMIVESAEFYDQLALNHYGRSPAHILLLHENDIAAAFLPALAARFRETGWEIISVDEAYADPIASLKPRTLVNNQGRVSAIAHALGAEQSALEHAHENEDYLDALFAERVVQNCDGDQ